MTFLARRRAPQMEGVSTGSGRSLFALDLGAVHDPARARIERIASMHSAAIVPKDKIAYAPDVLPSEFRPIDEAPQFVEQRFGICQLEPDQIGVAPTAEIQHPPTRVRVLAHQWMHRARRGQRIVGSRHTL